MNNENLAGYVAKIIRTVKKDGDKALVRYNARFDGVKTPASQLRIEASRIRNSLEAVPSELRKSIVEAAANIERFHTEELKNTARGWKLKKGGSSVGQVIRPVEKLGIYVPGGRFSYPSTVLMTAIPAKVAGVKRIVIVTPPKNITPALLFAAKTAGIKEIYGVGGPWAVAALACGTQTIPAVDMIIGPGNKYVNEAKRQVYGTVGIDSLAGPSEIAIIADESANEVFLAQDVLAQLEHDPDAKAYLYTDSIRLMRGVNKLLFGRIGRKQYSAVQCPLKRAVEAVDRLAPEHLLVACRNASLVAASVKNAGAVFVGNFSPVAAGDYWAGPSHALPTGASARFSSGVSVLTFLKRTSYIELSKSELLSGAVHIRNLAEAEGLVEHKKSIEVREG